MKVNFNNILKIFIVSVLMLLRNLRNDVISTGTSINDYIANVDLINKQGLQLWIFKTSI